jgi:hypothetical protein
MPGMTQRRLRLGPSPANGWPRSTASCSGSGETCTTAFCSAAAQHMRFGSSVTCGTAGYAYISAEGHVGPLVVTRDADANAVVTTVLRCALESEPSQVSMIVPGRADGVMQAVLALGLRLEEPYVLRASRPFGNWCNYLVRAPGFL